MKQKNNHARSKQKRKQLRLKNFRLKTIINRAEKSVKSNKNGNTPFSVLMAVEVKRNRQIFDNVQRQKRSGYDNLPNQRQRRKLARQTGNYK